MTTQSSLQQTSVEPGCCCFSFLRHSTLLQGSGAEQAFDGGQGAQQTFDESTFGFRASVLQELIESVGREQLRLWTTAEFTENWVKPRTELSRNAMTQDWYDNTAHRRKVGKAVLFVSHAWKYTVLDLFDATLDFVEHSQAKFGADPIIWVDILSVSQHRTGERDRAWWMATFFNAVGKMGSVVMIMSPYDKPLPLTRAWCVFELLACIANQGCQFYVTFPPEQRTLFLDKVKLDWTFLGMLTAQLATEQSECFFEADKAAIFEEIKTKGYSFPELDRMVIKSLEDAGIEFLLSEAQAAASLLERGKALKSLAELHLARARYEESLGFAEKAVEILKREEGEDGEWLQCAMSALGSNLIMMKRYEDAERVFKQLVETGIRLVGEENLSVLVYRTGLAKVYSERGDYGIALEEHQAVLEVKKKVLGVRHESTQKTMNEKGAMEYYLKDYSAAEKTHRECLELRRINLGQWHTGTAASLCNLGNVLGDLGRHEEALEMMEEALAVNQRALGETHPETKLTKKLVDNYKRIAGDRAGRNGDS